MFDFFLNLFRANVKTQARSVRSELEKQIAEQQILVNELAQRRIAYDDEIRRQKQLKTQSENDISTIQARIQSEPDIENKAALEKRLRSERFELKDKIESLDKLRDNYETFCDHLRTETNKLDQLKSQVRTAVVLNEVASSQLKAVDIQDNIDELKEETRLKESKLKVRKMFDEK